jgi:hypothetical protein
MQMLQSWNLSIYYIQINKIKYYAVGKKLKIDNIKLMN